MPQMPNVLPSVAVSTRGADPLEAEVHRLQILLNEQQAQVLETTRKLEEARKAIPPRTAA